MSKINDGVYKAEDEMEAAALCEGFEDCRTVLTCFHLHVCLHICFCILIWTKTSQSRKEIIIINNDNLNYNNFHYPLASVFA